MATLTLTKNYEDATLLLEADLDIFLDEVTTFVNTTKLNDDNIQDNGITASSKLANASVTTAKIADSAITTAKLADSAVITAKITDANVTTAKIDDAAVTTNKLADESVTAAKIPDGIVTFAKVETANYAVATCSNTGLSASTTDVLLGEVTVTSTGNPVMIFCQSRTGGALEGRINNWCKEGFVSINISIIRNSTGLCNLTQNFYTQQGVDTSTGVTHPYPNDKWIFSCPPGVITYVDLDAPAGSNTYKVYLKLNSSLYGAQFQANNFQLVAVEI